jgi:hypothetical protein
MQPISRTIDAATLDFTSGTITPVIAAKLYEIDPVTGFATLVGLPT